MAIDYTKRAEETVGQYNSRIASERASQNSVSIPSNPVTGKTNQQVLEESTRVAQEAQRVAGLPASAYIPPKITGSVLSPEPTPSTPVPTAPSVQDNYFRSTTEALVGFRADLEAQYQKQLDETRRRQEEAQTKINELAKKQEGVLAEADPLTQPFREQLETAERERLYVTENFEANQTLTRELDTLLTQGNNLIAQKKSLPISTAVLSQEVNKTIEDVSARAGVIQAVMSARNGQIGQAYNLIDRSVNAINADRRDRLGYLDSLLNFYETAKDDEGRKLVVLDNEEKSAIQKQIGLLENDLALAQDNAEYIKSLMTDPDSAMFMANAGVTLSDSPQKVAVKMAEQAVRDELNNAKNTLAQKGYVYVPFPSDTAGLLPQVVGGVTHYFRPPPGQSVLEGQRS